MKVASIKEAWEKANEVFPTDYIKDENSSERAGYPIFRSTAEGHYYDYICDLGCRLEVNLSDGNVVNIWIEADKRDLRIFELEKQVAKLTATLEKELDWKPHESERNVAQAEYQRLVDGVPGGSAYYMADNDAIDWICKEFDFDPKKITIIHEIDAEEINRHRQCRTTGKKIDRRPVYCATDYHYIRFNTTRWYYEVWNGQLREFYC
ncbi:MAG: hypothetical protein PHS57_06250 [Alphaproteobacteria bacterium]|nr:hypothetical protein [Alphaproteobacteria bacterium]